MIIIMGEEVKEIPIKPTEIQFEKDGRSFKYADAEGKQVKKIQVTASEYKWVYTDATEYTGKAYKVLNGKPVKEFSKTAIVKKYETINKGNVQYFINNELTYLLVSDNLKEEVKGLDSENKVITFKYVNRGFKIYKAVVSYDIELDKVFMRCYRGDLRKADLTETTTKKELTDNVDSLDLDDLEV